MPVLAAQVNTHLDVALPATNALAAAKFRSLATFRRKIENITLAV